MIANMEGKKIPNITFRTRRDGDWLDVTSQDLFANKKVVLFALPGAFTPTCSSTHLPRYNELAGVFKANGVDEIICLSVNDGFVMEAWGKNQGSENIRLIPDGNGEFSEKFGTLVNKDDLGFGKRSTRYSMFVKDGVVDKMFIESDVPGDPFEVSDADTMLKYLNPEAKLPPEITVISKPGCQFCIQAKKLLREHSLNFEVIELENGISYKTLRNLTGENTAPQVFIDSKHIKGLEGLQEFLKH